MDTIFTPGFILKTLFLYTLENQRYFADYYVKCDKSLVYKWINDTVNLPKKHVVNVVRFTIEQTRYSERLQIRNDIQQALSLSQLCDESKNSLSETEDFGEFLNGVLLHAITIRMEQRQGKHVVPEAPPSELSKEREDLTVILICGFFALVTGGILWSSLNRILGWQFFMGGSGNEPVGLSSFIWGVLANSPIIVFALVSTRKDTLLTLKNTIYLIVLYALFSGLGAFIFYNSGLRTFLEQMDLNYGFQEGIIAGVYGFVISSFPLLAFYLVLRRVRISLLWRILGICLPPVATSLTAMGTWIINRPELEVAQLRGFAVAMILRLFMFLIAYQYISNRQQCRRFSVHI